MIRYGEIDAFKTIFERSTQMIMNFPAPLLNTKQIAKTVDITAVKKYLFDFFSDLRPYLPITQGDLDNRAKIALDNFFTRADQKQDAKIFWYAICDFNNSLKVIFATDAKKPADSAGVSNLIQIFI